MSAQIKRIPDGFEEVDGSTACMLLFTKMVTAPRGGMPRNAVRQLAAPRRLGRSQIWLLAVLFFGVGDVVTTGLGIGMLGVTEAGPVTAPLVRQYGLGVLPVLKVAVFGAGYLLWKTVPRPHCVGVPLGLTVVGISATGWNLHVLVVALLS